MSNLKLQVYLATLLALLLFFSTPTEAHAVVWTINNESGRNQTLVGDSYINISSSNNVHRFSLQGILPISLGGTGTNSFTNGSIPFIWGGLFSQDNSNFFWDNTNKRLGIGTSSPTSMLEVLGNAKVSSLTSTDDSIINGLTIGLGGGSADSNTAFGKNALKNNTTGLYNTAIGWGTLTNQSSGAYNTAIGYQALMSISPGTGSDQNTAVGSYALRENTIGTLNNAFGVSALRKQYRKF